MYYCTGTGIYIGNKFSQDVVDLTFTDYMTNGVYVNNVRAHNNRREGLLLGHGIHFAVTNSKFIKNTTSDGIDGTPTMSGIDIEGEGYGTLGTFEYVTSVKIDGCYFTGNYIGVDVSDARNIIISNNNFREQNNGVDIYRNVRHITVESNIFNNNTEIYGGFIIETRNHNTIKIVDNVFTNAHNRLYHATSGAGAGDNITNLTISGNTFTYSKFETEPGVILPQFIFSNNLVTEISDATWTFGTPQFLNFENNVFFGQNGNTLMFEFRAASRCKFSNNIFAIGGGGCMQFIGGNTITISDNMFYDFQRATTTNIIRSTADNVFMTGNHIINNLAHTRVSLTYFDTPDYVSIIGNRVESIGTGDPVGACFFFSTGRNKVCAGNDCRNSGASLAVNAGAVLDQVITDISGNLI